MFVKKYFWNKYIKYHCELRVCSAFHLKTTLPHAILTCVYHIAVFKGLIINLASKVSFSKIHRNVLNLWTNDKWQLEWSVYMHCISSFDHILTLRNYSDVNSTFRTSIFDIRGSVLKSAESWFQFLHVQSFRVRWQIIPILNLNVFSSQILISRRRWKIDIRCNISRHLIINCNPSWRFIS